MDARPARGRGGGGRGPRARARDASASLTYDVDFSLQDPTTDTLACDDAGAPFRDALGALVLRPAGHGALLGNLSRAPAPVAMIKNIDNVAAAAHRGPTLEWTRAVVGRLGELKTQADALARRLADPADAAAPVEAGAWLSEHGWDEGGGAPPPRRG